jgi:hypothetical protein
MEWKTETVAGVRVRWCAPEHACVVDGAGKATCGHATPRASLVAWLRTARRPGDAPCPKCARPRQMLMITQGAGAAEEEAAPARRAPARRAVLPPDREFQLYTFGRDRCARGVFKELALGRLTSYQRALAWLYGAKGRAPHSILLYHQTGSGKTLSVWTILGLLYNERPRMQIVATTPRLARLHDEGPLKDIWGFWAQAAEGDYRILVKDGIDAEDVLLKGGASDKIAIKDHVPKFVAADLPRARERGGTSGKAVTKARLVERNDAPKNFFYKMRYDAAAQKETARVMTYRKLFNTVTAANAPGRGMWGQWLALPDQEPGARALWNRVQRERVRVEEFYLDDDNVPALLRGARVPNRFGRGGSIAFDPLRDAVLAVDEIDLFFNPAYGNTFEMVLAFEAMVSWSYAASGVNAVRLVLATATPVHDNLRRSFRILNLLQRDPGRRVRDVGSGMHCAGPSLNDVLGGAPERYFETPKMEEYLRALPDAVSHVDLSADSDRFPVVTRETLRASVPTTADGTRDRAREYAVQRFVERETRAKAKGVRGGAAYNAERFEDADERTALTAATIATAYLRRAANYVEQQVPDALHLGKRSFVPATAAALASGTTNASPKLARLVANIRALDEAARRAGRALPKHAVLCDANGWHGAPLVAAGLTTVGVWRYFERVRGGVEYFPNDAADASDTSFVVLARALLNEDEEAKYEPSTSTSRVKTDYEMRTRAEMVALRPAGGSADLPAMFKEAATRRIYADKVDGTLYLASREGGVEAFTPEGSREDVPLAQILGEAGFTFRGGPLKIEELQERGLVRWNPSLTAEQSSAATAQTVARFNAPENDAHRFARVIVVGLGFTTGVDLFNVEHVHLFDAPVTERDRIQMEGRAVRMCGHQRLRASAAYRGAPTRLHVWTYEAQFSEPVPTEGFEETIVDDMRDEVHKQQAFGDLPTVFETVADVIRVVQQNPAERVALVALDRRIQRASFAREANQPRRFEAPMDTGYVKRDSRAPVYRDLESGALVDVAGARLFADGARLTILWTNGEVRWQGPEPLEIDVEQEALERAMLAALDAQIKELRARGGYPAPPNFALPPPAIWRDTQPKTEERRPFITRRDTVLRLSRALGIISNLSGLNATYERATFEYTTEWQAQTLSKKVNVFENLVRAWALMAYGAQPAEATPPAVPARISGVRVVDEAERVVRSSFGQVAWERAERAAAVSDVLDEALAASVARGAAAGKEASDAAVASAMRDIVSINRLLKVMGEQPAAQIADEMAVYADWGTSFEQATIAMATTRVSITAARDTAVRARFLAISASKRGFVGGPSWSGLRSTTARIFGETGVPEVLTDAIITGVSPGGMVATARNSAEIATTTVDAFLTEQRMRGQDAATPLQARIKRYIAHLNAAPEVDVTEREFEVALILKRANNPIASDEQETDALKSVTQGFLMPRGRLAARAAAPDFEGVDPAEIARALVAEDGRWSDAAARVDTARRSRANKTGIFIEAEGSFAEGADYEIVATHAPLRSDTRLTYGPVDGRREARKEEFVSDDDRTFGIWHRAIAVWLTDGRVRVEDFAAFQAVLDFDVDARKKGGSPKAWLACLEFAFQRLILRASDLKLVARVTNYTPEQRAARRAREAAARARRNADNGAGDEEEARRLEAEADRLEDAASGRRAGQTIRLPRLVERLAAYLASEMAARAADGTEVSARTLGGLVASRFAFFGDVRAMNKTDFLNMLGVVRSYENLFDEAALIAVLAAQYVPGLSAGEILAWIAGDLPDTKDAAAFLLHKNVINDWPDEAKRFRDALFEAGRALRESASDYTILSYLLSNANGLVFDRASSEGLFRIVMKGGFGGFGEEPAGAAGASAAEEAPRRRRRAAQQAAIIIDAVTAGAALDAEEPDQSVVAPPAVSPTAPPGAGEVESDIEPDSGYSTEVSEPGDVEMAGRIRGHRMERRPMRIVAPPERAGHAISPAEIERHRWRERADKTWESATEEGLVVGHLAW